MNQKPSILIDVDDVIVKNVFIAAFNKFTHKSYKEEDFTEYYFINGILNDKEKVEFANYIMENNIYENCELIENAQEVMSLLSNILDLHIASSCIFIGAERTSGALFEKKFTFLMKHFPFLNPHKIILSGEKNCFSGFKYQIDDRLENLKSDIKYKFLFTRNHNKDISTDTLNKYNVIRVDSWIEILENILKIEFKERKSDIKTYNFNPKYLEIALLDFDEIDECDYIYIIELINYFNSVEKYSLDFPINFSFIKPTGEEDEEYNDIKDWLVDNGFCNAYINLLTLTKKGKNFFKKLENKCLSIEETFAHYFNVRC